jgi:hypothetical protein
VATIAHRESDYLIKFDSTQQNVFGPIVPNVDNYLYVTLDLLSGTPNFGITTLEPVVSSIEPTAIAGQLWFDLTVPVLKVRNSSNTKWIESPGVVIGCIAAGALYQAYTVGSSANLSNVQSNPGYIMLDSQLRPVRTSTGELLTTQTQVLVKTTSGTSGILTEPIDSFIPVRATEAIPAMSLVYFSGADAVALADPSSERTAPVGLITEALATDEIGILIQVGEITYDQWAFADSDIGLALYSGANGTFSTERPSAATAYKIGFIKNAKTILLGIDSETKTIGTNVLVEAPLRILTSTALDGSTTSTITIDAASASQPGYMTAAQVQLLESFDSRITTVEGEIQTKADIVHAHSIADIDGLQAALDGKSDVGHTHSEYALVNHRHQISDIDGLSDIAGNVALTADVTVIGTTVGAAGEGTVFPTGMTFQQFVEAISTKLAHPTYVAPSIVISSTTAAGSYEYGTALNLTFSLSYHQNNGGLLNSISYYRDNTQVSSTSPYSVQLSLTDSTSFFLVGAYGDGPVLNNNLGQPDPTGQILASSTQSNTITYTPIRLAFYGSTSLPITTSNAVRSLPYSSANSGNNSTVSAAGVATGSTVTPNFTITVPVGAARVVFAYPATSRSVASVKLQELSDSEVKSNFVETSVSVQGANGSAAVTYRVFTYTPVEPFAIVNNYKVFI